MPNLQELILLLPVLLLSLSLHEYCHGKASALLGDPTPGMMGRLTLNPLAHLDLMGSLVLIMTRRFGWAKPVPIDPRYYKEPRRDIMLVGLAGPAANIFLAITFSIILKLILSVNNLTMNNLILYGYASQLMITIVQFLILAVMVNFALAFFNLLPIPPLDGSKILRGFLPSRFDKSLAILEGPGGMMIIFLLAITGILGRIISPVIFFALNLIGF